MKVKLSNCRCGAKAKIDKYYCRIQASVLYRPICVKNCPPSYCFATKNLDCAIELWESAIKNYRKTLQTNVQN